MEQTKQFRFELFLLKLRQAQCVDTAEQALNLIAETLNGVEDEYSGIPFNPDAWLDGRMYPPRVDAARVVPGRPDVTRYRSKAHNTYVRKNGAIKIVSTTGNEIILDKPGADGQGVDDL